MKRSPLNRKTPLKRTPMKKARSRITRGRRSRTAAVRKWAENHPWCFSCGWRLGTWKEDGLPILDVHEIIGAGARWRTESVLACLMSYCRTCHEEETSTPRREDVIRELGWKQQNDPDGHNLVLFNQQYTWHDKPAITEDEILDFMDSRENEG